MWHRLYDAHRSNRLMLVANSDEFSITGWLFAMVSLSLRLTKGRSVVLSLIWISPFWKSEDIITPNYTLCDENWIYIDADVTCGKIILWEFSLHYEIEVRVCWHLDFWVWMFSFWVDIKTVQILSIIQVHLIGNQCNLSNHQSTIHLPKPWSRNHDVDVLK